MRKKFVGVGRGNLAPTTTEMPRIKIKAHVKAECNYGESVEGGASCFEFRFIGTEVTAYGVCLLL